MALTRLQRKKLEKEQDSDTKAQQGQQKPEQQDSSQLPRSEDTLPTAAEDGTLHSQRYTTPAAPSPPRSPPPLQPQKRIGSPGLFNTGETRRCYMSREDIDVAKYGVPNLASKFKRFEEQPRDPTHTDPLAPLRTEDMTPLGSPYDDRDPSSKRKLGPEGTESWDFTPGVATPTPALVSDDFRTEPRAPLNGGLQNLRKQALGPHGTFLIDEEGNLISYSD